MRVDHLETTLSTKKMTLYGLIIQLTRANVFGWTSPRVLTTLHGLRIQFTHATRRSVRFVFVWVYVIAAARPSQHSRVAHGFDSHTATVAWGVVEINQLFGRDGSEAVVNSFLKLIVHEPHLHGIAEFLLQLWCNDFKRRQCLQTSYRTTRFLTRGRLRPVMSIQTFFMFTSKNNLLATKNMLSGKNLKRVSIRLGDGLRTIKSPGDLQYDYSKRASLKKIYQSKTV